MAEPATILLVDDEATERRLLYHLLKADYRVLEAEDGAGALDVVEREAVDLVILDLHLPPDPDTADGGVRTLKEVRARRPWVPVVIATGDRDRNVALEMVRQGATDFLLKPLDPDVLRIVVVRALERARLESELRDLRRTVRRRHSFGSLIGQSPVAQKMFARLQKLAGVPTTVLLLGESGVGKSSIARVLHEEGSRADGPFVVVDGAAIPESLMESEMFGHVRGAFTGADVRREGRIRKADGGTLFLDEIGNLNAAAQAKLLLFLDNRTYSPVGSSEEICADVRLIAATNRSLEDLVLEGSFRQDLLFRLQVATVDLPPLRDRRGDIASLAEHFLDTLSEEMGRRPPRLSVAALKRLLEFSWPGNIRQLQHVLESSLVLLDGEDLDPGDLMIPPEENDAAREGIVADSSEGLPLKERITAFERAILVDALAASAGNKSSAGRALGLDDNQIRYLCRKHGLG
ncbi:MAG: sigma-54 dependent transcriptional regulator [Gemmatimonadota bacterium]|jgi:DNA-binding NtrC family response regulator|nr:sigma-54 dependent transcriptional regulator [Gemmatimonadota bacterium]